jgi:enoyl-[acyl-carrier-protein] reductase (NADH)
LVLGIANEHSIAFGCARAFRKVGAELAITYLNDKARLYVEPLAQELEAPIFFRSTCRGPVCWGANRVVPNYNVMGPVKAALEASVRYLAHELGPQGIRVHALSPGPIKTRAASGLKDFDLLLNEATQRAPVSELVDIDDVGMAAAYLATPYARRITGSTVYVDSGLNIMA